MSKFKHITLAATLLAAGSAIAQVPSHPMYVQKTPTGTTSFYDYFKNWEPGQKITDDDNFFISRVRPRERFVDQTTQVDPSKTADRKICWWCPIGISDNAWTSLPRNKFDADAFSMWQYIDIHGNWSDGWIRVPGAFSDVAHKNGVSNGCVLFFDGSNYSATNTLIGNLTAKGSDGKFVNAQKLVRFMKYYGIDGLGVNPEGSLYSPDDLKSFFEECHKVAKEEGWHFKVYWYESMTNYGSVSYSNSLTAYNSEWFQREGSSEPVTDMFMLNYNWGVGTKISSSASVATELGRSSYDVYAGFDTQGRWIRDKVYGTPTGWSILSKNPVSIAFWGAHQKNMIYENSNEFGSDSYTIQSTYQKKQEQFFTGGTRNPLTAPAINDNVSSASWEGMKSFHGVSKFIPARSTYNQLPFITRFGLGNGEFFNAEGKKSFGNEWYNVGVQDYLPTWRWWVVDDNGNAVSDAINCEFTYEDAWFGGSALKLSGNTTKSNIRMFKTQFDVAGSDEVTVRFKLQSGDASHLSLIWSADGTTFKSKALESTTVGEWVTVTAKASEIGMSGTVKELGFAVENTPANYSLLIGELAINNNKSYSPNTPTITSSTVLNGTYNSVAFKLIYDCKEQDPSKLWEPIYNDDVDTWYFEVYSQIEGQKEVLCTTTTSWAAYVVGAPASSEKGVKTRFGVCAVAPDGKTKSPIAWTEYMDRPIENSENVVVDKPVIKKNEEFTVSFEDTMHPDSYSWTLTNAATGETVITKNNVTSITTSIAEEGVYDLCVCNQSTDAGTYYRAIVQISPDETGAVPQIGALTVDKTEIEAGSDVNASFTVTRLGEGKVSRGVAVRDPQMLRLPNEVAKNDNFSIAMWFKVEKYAHGRFGTNLINRRDYTINWPHNNWGTIWVHIWPNDVYDINNNVISYTLWNNSNPGFNGNVHESPNSWCMGNDHSIMENVWTHVVITASNGTQTLWINGKKVGQESQTSTYRDNTNSNPEKNYVYIGGTNVYHGGLIGVVDDVQFWTKALDEDGVKDAMKGYTNRTIPAELSGYWDFEDAAVTANGSSELSSFKNKGKGGEGMLASIVKFEGAGGESTTGMVTSFVAADNDELGNPALPGTLDVKTSAEWVAEGATVTEGNNSAKLNYAAKGDYDIVLNLVNRWGKDTKTAAVVVGDPAAVEMTAATDMKVYPNPFVEYVNVMFAAAGDYTIEVVGADGRMVGAQQINASANEVVSVNVNGAPGIYVVRVLNGNKVIKSLKVIKK